VRSFSKSIPKLLSLAGAHSSACTALLRLRSDHNRLVAGSSPAGPTTQSRRHGDFPNRRQKPTTGGLSFRCSVSATAHFGLKRGFRGMCLCRKIPDSQESETGSTETRFDAALARREAKDPPLARPFGRQVGNACHAHAVGKPAVDRGRDEIGSEECERECPVHIADAALLALGNTLRACSGSVMSSLSQRRLRAIDATRVARFSDLMRRTC